MDKPSQVNVFEDKQKFLGILFYVGGATNLLSVSGMSVAGSSSVLGMKVLLDCTFASIKVTL